jgi:Fic family protein
MVAESAVRGATRPTCRQTCRLRSPGTNVWRLLITLLLVAKDVLPQPPLYLSAYFETTRPEYYARLLAVTERGEWEEWLAHFLAAVAHQAEDAVGRIHRIEDLMQHWRQRLEQAPSGLPDRALGLFAENPFWNINRIADRLEVACTTAQRAVDRLESARIVTLTGQAKRNRVYCARDILAILEEPPRASGGGAGRSRAGVA